MLMWAVYREVVSVRSNRERVITGDCPTTDVPLAIFPDYESALLYEDTDHDLQNNFNALLRLVDVSIAPVRDCGQNSVGGR